MPTVMHVLSRFMVGGPSIVITSIVNNISKDFKTILVIGNKADYEKEPAYLRDAISKEVEIIFIKEMKRSVNPFLDYRAYKKMSLLMRQYKPDIVHTHSAKAGIIGRLAAYKNKVPVIIHMFHGHVFHSYFGKFKTAIIIKIEQFLARLSTGIIAISKTQGEELKNVYHIAKAEKIKVIPLGFPLQTFLTGNESKKDLFRKKYNVGNNEIVIAHIARVEPIKNHEFFIDIINQLKNEFRNKMLRFFIVGDGSGREKMEQKIRSFHLDYQYNPEGKTSSMIVCTSWIDNVDEALSGSDIIMLTSLNEGTPLSLIEAQANARPVVATNVGGVKDIMEDGVTGFLINDFSINEAVSKISLLINDVELAKTMGLQGRKFVTEKFTSEIFNSNLAKYYNEQLQLIKN